MVGKKKTQHQWKPVAIDTQELTLEDFENFGGIEELQDYTLVNANKKGDSPKNCTSKKGIKRKKTQELFETSVESIDSEWFTMNEEVSVNSIERPKKAKKKKKSRGTEDSKITKCESKNESIEDEDQEKLKLDLSAWCNCFVPDDILRALEELGFVKPTPIQELVLPPAIRDHQDILGAAETGSGKTLAFGIPMISHIIASKDREDCNNLHDPSKLRGLVLAPTRELALQVRDHLQAVSKYVDVKIAAVVGGMAPEKQRRVLKKSPDIVVATPGRLWELMEEGNPHLSQISDIRYLVIDEADRMVEKGHFAELTQILEIINGNKEIKRRQTFVFSATLTIVHELPNRLTLKKRKGKLLQKNKLESLIELIGMKEKPKIIDITRKTGLVETLTESQIVCSQADKDMYLYYFIVMYPGRTLVFCNSIDCVRRLKTVFEHLGCHPLPLHASMHQRQRLKNLENFASSKHGLLLATDVAARGLDIKGIEHVVHFQVPRTAEIYVHRSGRTARAQNVGFSLMLVEPQDGVFYKRVCKTLNKDRSLASFPIDQGVLKIIKERVTLARSIDQQEHRFQRQAAQNRWFIKAAEEMDVDIEDERLLNDLGDDRERSVKTRQIKGMKKHLQMLLKKPLVPKLFTGSYPTKSGKLLECTQYGKETAVRVMQKDSHKKPLFQSKKNKSKRKVK